MKFIPVAEPDLSGNELKYVTDCVKTGWISSQGKYVNEFEEKFSQYCNMKYGVSVFNGTVALHLALAALNLKPGDEVIVPNITYISTANAAFYVGAKPIIVDVEPDTGNIDPNKIEEKITKKTKAIIPVHLYGHPCDMDKITDIAERKNLFIIEDCAEAHGAEYKHKKVGSFSTISCFSFFANKIITSGEGGMCLTNDEKLAKRMQLLRNHAMSETRKYYHEEIGYNYRMTNIQAALGVAQMEKIDKFIDIKRKNAALYNKLLKNIKGLTLPVEKSYAKHVYWMYSPFIEREFHLSREELVEKLKQNNIESRPLFVPLNQQPVLKTKEKFPVSEALYQKGLSVPSSIKLTEKEIKYICEVIRN